MYGLTAVHIFNFELQCCALLGIHSVYDVCCQNCRDQPPGGFPCKARLWTHTRKLVTVCHIIALFIARLGREGITVSTVLHRETGGIGSNQKSSDFFLYMHVLTTGKWPWQQESGLVDGENNLIDG